MLVSRRSEPDSTSTDLAALSTDVSTNSANISTNTGSIATLSNTAVTTSSGTQSIAGSKTFSSPLTASNGLSVTGNITHQTSANAALGNTQVNGSLTANTGLTCNGALAVSGDATVGSSDDVYRGSVVSGQGLFARVSDLEAYGASVSTRIEPRGFISPYTTTVQPLAIGGTAYQNSYTKPQFFTATQSTADSNAVRIVRTTSTAVHTFPLYGNAPHSWNVNNAWWAASFSYPHITFSKAKLDGLHAMGITEVGFAFDADNTNKQARLGFSLVSSVPEANQPGSASNNPPGTDAPGIFTQFGGNGSSAVTGTNTLHGFRWRRGVIDHSTHYSTIADNAYYQYLSQELSLTTTTTCELMISTTAPYHLIFRHLGPDNDVTEFKTSDSRNTQSSITGGLNGSECFGANWASDPTTEICLDGALMTNGYTLDNLRYITSRI